MTVDLDVLLSVAEISVAFAGFAGIITAVTGRTGGGWDPANLTRFRLMIYSSLSAVVACLMPYVFLLNSEEVDWGWSIGLLGIFLLAFSAFWIRSFFLRRSNLNNYVSFWGFLYCDRWDRCSIRCSARVLQSRSGRLLSWCILPLYTNLHRVHPTGARGYT